MSYAFADGLDFVGISTLDELLHALETRSEEIVRTAFLWVHFPIAPAVLEGYEASLHSFQSEQTADTNPNADTTPYLEVDVPSVGFGRGLSIFYLLYLLVVDRDDLEFAAQYFRQSNIGGDELENAIQLLTIFRWLRGH